MNESEKNVAYDERIKDFSHLRNEGVLKSTLSSVLAGKNNALIIAMFIVAVCFSLIGGVGWKVAQVLKDSNSNSLDKDTLEIIGYALVIAPWIGSLFVSWKLKTINPFWIVLLLVMFTVGNIIGLGFVFLKYDVPSEWLFIFTVAGGIFLFASLLGYFFGKWLNKFWKFIVAISIFWFIALIVVLILRYAIPSPIVSDIHLAIIGVFGILTIFYIMHSVNRLKNFSHVVGEERHSINTILYLSFRLLFDLIRLVWILARIFILDK